MDFSFILDRFYLKTLFQGLLITVLLALIAVVLGTIIALLPTYFRLSKHKILNFIGASYVEIIRGTPLLVQVMVLYAFIQLPVITVLGMYFSAFLRVIFALIINSSDYASDTFIDGSFC